MASEEISKDSLKQAEGPHRKDSTAHPLVLLVGLPVLLRNNLSQALLQLNIETTIVSDPKQALNFCEQMIAGGATTAGGTTEAEHPHTESGISTAIACGSTACNLVVVYCSDNGGSTPHRNVREIIHFLEILKAKGADDPQPYDSDLEIIVIAEKSSSIQTAVQAMKAGASDFENEPINVHRLAAKIERLLSSQSRFRKVLEQKIDLQERMEKLESRYSDANIIGNSPAMRQVFKQIKLIAKARSTILITGESGTGKELVAHAIHLNSPRQNNPFVKLSCGALSESIIESELFGHEKGSFTGATNSRKGRFELADTGTLFLDEIGDISPLVQIKLLRVLQEREFERVGGSITHKVDVRLIAATNRDLAAAVSAGKFRQDLYFRLNVISVRMPALRERLDDLPLLVDTFIAEFAKENNKEIKGITSRALSILRKYHWPGNVRELKNCLEGMVVLSSRKTLDLDDIPEPIRNNREVSSLASVDINNLLARSEAMVYRIGQLEATKERLSEYKEKYEQLNVDLHLKDLEIERLRNKISIWEPGMTLADSELQIIRAVLKEVNGNKSKAAQILNIGRKTLQRKLLNELKDNLERDKAVAHFIADEEKNSVN